MIAVQPLIARSREKIAFLFTHSIQFCDSSAPSLSAGEKAATKTAAAAMMGLNANVCVMAFSHNGCTLPSNLTCQIYDFNRKNTRKRDKSSPLEEDRHRRLARGRMTRKQRQILRFRPPAAR